MTFSALDSGTRAYMRGEVERDIDNGSLRLSHLLSPAGLEHYPDLLLQAIDRGTSATLAAALQTQCCLDPTSLNAGDTAQIEWQAAAVRLARREFCRFVTRGICARAAAAGFELVEVYRARAPRQALSGADSLVGRRLNVLTLLETLRAGETLDGALGLPKGGCSGLSIRPGGFA
jgi:hypothetical protein